MQDQQIQLTEAESNEQRLIQLEKMLHTERIQGSNMALALLAQRETAFGDKVRARVQAEGAVANAEIVALHKADGSVVPLREPDEAA